MHRIPVLSSLIVLLIVSTTSAAPPQYAVIDLGHDAAVIAVDPQGNGVGSWQGQAALFTLNGTHGLLGSLPNGSSSVATNRDGIHGSVGFSATIPDTSIGQEGTHAFYRFNGIMHDLGTFQGNPFSFASALNSTIAVGWGGATGVDGSVPLSWRLKGGPAVRLATLGGPTGFVHALRPSGVAVGSSD